jgi:hypothetical protein
MKNEEFAYPDWINEFQGIITICDRTGKIVYLNNRAIKNFEKDGGINLLGSDIYACHPEAASIKLRKLIENCETNIYYTLRNRVRHLIHQSPLFEKGEYKWFAEFIFDIPEETITHIRS